LPRSALNGIKDFHLAADYAAPKTEAFDQPDPFRDQCFPTSVAAKLAIADYLGIPLARLAPELLSKVDEILGESLDKSEVIGRIQALFKIHATEDKRC
jgi:hypothetical protein